MGNVNQVKDRFLSAWSLSYPVGCSITWNNADVAQSTVYYNTNTESTTACSTTTQCAVDALPTCWSTTGLTCPWWSAYMRMKTERNSDS